MSTHGQSAAGNLDIDKISKSAHPLPLRDWNQALRTEFHGSGPAKGKDEKDREVSTGANDVDTCQPRSQGKHMGESARRVLTSSQKASEYAFRHKITKHLDKDGLQMQAQGLSDLPDARSAEYWVRKATHLEEFGQGKQAEGVLLEALQRDVQPVAQVARALHELQKRLEKENEGFIAGSQNARSFVAHARKSLTPSGISGQAVRVPSRLAKTPGSAAREGIAPPPTSFKGILKRLEFSVAKSTATKQLHFPDDAITTATKSQQQRTPYCWSNKTGIRNILSSAGGVPTGRRVTFGGADEMDVPKMNVSSVAEHPNTPSTIEEEEEEDEVDNDNDDLASSTGTVNSKNAGSTPFDRRLSALFAKYRYDAEDDAKEEDGCGNGNDRETAKTMESEELFGFDTKECIRQLVQLDVKEDEGKTENMVKTLAQLLRRSLEDLNAAKAAENLERMALENPKSAQRIRKSPETLTPMSIDGVVRDSHSGIPLVTPNTVTTQRGSQHAEGSANSLNDSSQSIATNLSRSFDTPPSNEFTFCSLAATSDCHSSARRGKSSKTISSQENRDDTPEMLIPKPKGTAQRLAYEKSLLLSKQKQDVPDGDQVLVPSKPSSGPRQKKDLQGSVTKVATPVRRSPRLMQASQKNDEAGSMNIEVLEATGYAYAPNHYIPGSPLSRKKGETSKKAAGKAKSNLKVEVTEDARTGSVHSYSTRSATKSRRRSSSQGLKLSPTEQNIRNSLKMESSKQRSRRKSTHETPMSELNSNASRT